MKPGLLGGFISFIGGFVPAAPDKSIQFNDGGVFGGDAALTWDKASKTLLLSGAANGVDLRISNTGGAANGHLWQFNSAINNNLTFNTLKDDFTVGMKFFNARRAATDRSRVDKQDFIVENADSVTTYSVTAFDVLYSNAPKNPAVAVGELAFQVIQNGTQIGDDAVFYTGESAATAICKIFATNKSQSAAYLTNGPTGPSTGVVSADGEPLLFGVGTNAQLMLDSTQNTVTNFSALAAADTNKFFYLPLLTGGQTGVPAKLTGAYANSAPVRLQNNGGVYSLVAYINGGWRSVVLI